MSNTTETTFGEQIMSLKRKPEKETAQETTTRKQLVAVSNHATRSEKTSWIRKRANLLTFIESEIRPLEEQILDIRTALEPLYDKCADLRKEMVGTCIHPYDELRALDDGTIQCTFCSKILKASSL